VPDLVHVGRDGRELLGTRHRPAGAVHGAMLVCPPLLQEGIRCQRALWSLSEMLASGGVDVLRFDWFGSGDSAGDSDAISVAGLVDDIRSAAAFLRTSSDARGRIRMLGLRSAALPLLACASASREPSDLVLWAPQLDGRELVAGWREQHRRQLRDVGRFLRKDTVSDDAELLGFVLAPSLLGDLEALQGRELTLPAGSRIVVAQWAGALPCPGFVRAQEAAGVVVEFLELERADAPAWDDPVHFDTQLFPRRAVGQLGPRLAAYA
jgi:hypothetical protein